jgi:hypothetical protein|tara:strand:- start:569 stop:763 length:195 start_codon:yes stop_codon:yes gene_type:complete
MKIEKWNAEKNIFEQVEATDSDIDELYYVLEYSMAEAQIEEAKRAIIEDGMSFIDNILKKSKNN